MPSTNLFSVKEDHEVWSLTPLTLQIPSIWHMEMKQTGGHDLKITSLCDWIFIHLSLQSAG